MQVPNPPIKMERQVSVPASEYIFLNGIEQYLNAIQVSEENINRIVDELINDPEVIKSLRSYESRNTKYIGIKRKIDETE